MEFSSIVGFFLKILEIPLCRWWPFSKLMYIAILMNNSEPTTDVDTFYPVQIKVINYVPVMAPPQCLSLSLSLSVCIYSFAPHPHILHPTTTGRLIFLLSSKTQPYPLMLLLQRLLTLIFSFLMLLNSPGRRSSWATQRLHVV